MVELRYVVTARKHSGTVEFSERADRAVCTVGAQKREADSAKVGAALWEAMRAGGANLQAVNGFAVFEGNPDGVQIASVHPVMEGARATWMVLYRADKDASAYRPLPSVQKIGDALDLLFQKLASEIRQPHKP